MSGQATSLEELRKLLTLPQRLINKHLEDQKKSGGQPIQMPQVVPKSVVAPPVQPVAPTQQKQTINTPTVVPPKKGGCGCWGAKK